MTSYVIRGGQEGRNRLRIVSRALSASTLNLLTNAGIRPGSACLDVGCGGGDVTLAMAQLVGPSGTVTGVDIDATKMQLAQHDAERESFSNVRFLVLAVDQTRP